MSTRPRKKPIRSGFQEIFDLPQDASKHGRSQASRLSILLAGVIGGEEARKTMREGEARSMREAVGGERCDQPLSFQEVEVRIKRDASQGQNRAGADKFQFLLEIRNAIADFFGQRLVIRRRAANRGGNQRVFEDQAIIGAFRVRLISEACAMELLVKEIA